MRTPILSICKYQEYLYANVNFRSGLVIYGASPGDYLLLLWKIKTKNQKVEDPTKT